MPQDVNALYNSLSLVYKQEAYDYMLYLAQKSEKNPVNSNEHPLTKLAGILSPTEAEQIRSEKMHFKN